MLGMECFEGMKCFVDQRNQLRLFRPMENMARFRTSSQRMGLPVSTLARGVLVY
jgi:branched-subunit amino acid aminotransferase/4-amino-4-deoxychorismate lyase